MKILKLLMNICLVAVLPQQGYSEPPLRMGALLCLSDECAEWGQASKQGMQLAAEELNRGGGVLGRKLEFVFVDSRDVQAGNAVRAYKQLSLEKDIHFIVGPSWTNGGMAIAPLIARNNSHIVISPSVGVRDFNESADNIFKVWPHDENGTRELARYARKKGYKRAAIFGSPDPWTRTQSAAFQDEFEKLGGKLTIHVEPPLHAAEIRAEALRIKASNPDVVFFSNLQIDRIGKEFQALQFSVAKLAILMEPERLKVSQGSIEGIVFAQYEKATEEFVHAFQERFGAAPGVSSDTAYDAVKVIAQAITNVQSFEPEKVKQELYRIKNFAGASGIFSFDEKGAVNKKPVLWRVKGMEYEKVQDFPCCDAG